MTTKNPADLSVAMIKREGGMSTPLCDIADNAAGALFGALAKGKYIVTTSEDVYWTRGPSTLLGTDVLVDEATPSTDMPLRANESYEFIVEADDALFNYLAARTVSGNPDALVHVIFEGDFARQ